MRPDHATHLQNIADLDDGDDSDLCKRDSCWQYGAGVVVCFVFKSDGDRCRECDHMPACHPDNGEALEEEWLRHIEADSPELGAALRGAVEDSRKSAPEHRGGGR